MIEALLAGLFGLLIGSFLNVCIYRLPRELSVVRPRSFCPNCKHTVAAYDNIPVVSFLILRGRCRYCETRIPSRYPVVEVLTGVLFFFLVLWLGAGLAALRLCVFCALNIVLIFTDLEDRTLPDIVTVGGALAGIGFAALVPVSPWVANWPRHQRLASVLESLIAGLFIALTLWAVGVLYKLIRHREGLGLGDVKMIAMIGTFLGLEAVLLTLIAGSTLGAIVGLLYIRISKKDPSTYELPLGSFLGIAAILVAFYGEAVLDWYARLF